MTMYAVEGRHKVRAQEYKWETIAKFDDLAVAKAYVARHQGDGGVRLRVLPTRDYQSLQYVVIGAGHRASFTYLEEAFTYDEGITGQKEQDKPQKSRQEPGNITRAL